MSESPTKNKTVERFAQILACTREVPKLEGGRIITEPNSYAVSYEDGNNKIPEWARLKLSPHNTFDMHGRPRTSYIAVLEINHEEGLDDHLKRLIREKDGGGISINAIHEVRNVNMSQTNGKGRIIRTIEPSQNLYYHCKELPCTAQANLGAFRTAVVEKILQNGAHDMLRDFKHVVSVVKRIRNPEFQYRLPAALPEEYINRIREVNLCVSFGNRHVNVSFVLEYIESNVLPFRPRTNGDPKETGIDSVYRPFELDSREMAYMNGYFSRGDAKLMHWNLPSTTCEEKNALLKKEIGGEMWSLDRIISTHYFEGPTGLIVLVGPRLSEIDDPISIISNTTGIEKGRIRESVILPTEMEHGTCTPFAYMSTIKHAVDAIVLLRTPDGLMNAVADYSIGGRGPSAHRASLHMTPRMAELLITQEFGHVLERVRGRIITTTHPLFAAEMPSQEKYPLSTWRTERQKPIKFGEDS
jgi:hypothetical protein